MHWYWARSSWSNRNVIALESKIEIRFLDKEEVKVLRHAVLWPHLDNLDACAIEPDSLITTFHIGATKNSEIVGTSTLIAQKNKKFETPRQYRLRAMATAPSVRGEGVGAKIIEQIIKELKEREVELLWCDARIIATGFYERQSFETKGEIYQVPKIGPHKLMYKVL